jgi:transposase-like protein
MTWTPRLAGRRGTQQTRVCAGKLFKLYKAAVECLQDDFEHLVTYLWFPAEHRERIRYSSFIERAFGDTRWLVKVSAGCPASVAAYQGGRARPGQLRRRATDHRLDRAAH